MITRPLSSRIDRNSDVFKSNYEANEARLEQLRDILAQARAGGGEKYVTRHLERGKLLPRQRIELLLDRDAQRTSYMTSCSKCAALRLCVVAHAQQRQCRDAVHVVGLLLLLDDLYRD